MEAFIKEREDLSVIFDKRFNWFPEIVSMLEIAETTNRDVKIFDIDTPLLVSIGRVFLRTIQDPDPRTPFSVIADGFATIRSHRQELINLVNIDPLISFYILIETSSGQIAEVAEAGNGTIVIRPGMEAVFEQITSETSDSEIYALGEKVINENFINQAIHLFPAHQRFRIRMAFEEYIGSTVSEALEKHSNKI